MKKIITVLSVRQPWAWLIIQGFKPIENRTWRTNYRGELYIHAGKAWDQSAMFKLHNMIQFTAISEINRHFTLGMGDVIRYHPDEFGAIIGRVTLAATFNPKLPLPSDLQTWAEPDCWHWKVEKPVKIAPIPMRGQLGLFKAEIEVPA